MEQYSSQVNNTCKLKLHIPLENIIDTVFSKLDLKYEVAGVIYCDESNNPVHLDINKGESDSVYTPNNVINYHTHPISAYNQGNTVWGWPSGEDIRETIKFGLAGNKAHLVFTVEGLYTIQVNPCKLKKMKELLTSEERGIIIFMIEEYFKTTHNFRGVQEVNKLAKNNMFITPYSFIDFANSFSLHNLLTASTKSYKKLEHLDIRNVGHTGIHSEENDNIMKYAGLHNEIFSKIPNIGYPEVKSNYIITLPAKKYIDDSNLEELRSVNEFGQEEHCSKNIRVLFKKYQVLADYIDGTHKCDDTWNSKNPNSWFFINFFPSVYYVQKKYIENNRYITPNKGLLNYIHLNHEPFIRMFSNQKEGCSVSMISKKNNFKTLFSFANNNSFGSTLPKINDICILFKVFMEDYILKNKKPSPRGIKRKIGSITLKEITSFIKYITK